MRSTLPIVAVALTLTAASAAQTARSQLQRVDEGHADVSPLGTSLRQMEVDLRQPIGFQHAYRVPGRDDLLMRSSGGLYATFPQSVYVPTRQGLVPLVPAGTVFHIGTPNFLAEAADPVAAPPRTRVLDRHEAFLHRRTDSRINTLVVEEEQSRPIDPPLPRHLPLPIGPTVATDESYRSQRVAELIARAAEAHRGPTSSQ